MNFKEYLLEAQPEWTVTAKKNLNKVKKGESQTVKARNAAEAIKKAAKKWGDDNLKNFASTDWDIKKK